MIIRKIIIIKNGKTPIKYTYGSMQGNSVSEGSKSFDPNIIIYRIKKKRDKTCLIYYR